MLRRTQSSRSGPRSHAGGGERKARSATALAVERDRARVADVPAGVRSSTFAPR
jgi:hypothetical protein